MPGLSTHTRTSSCPYLRDAVPPAPDFVSWVRDVMAGARRRGPIRTRPRSSTHIVAACTRPSTPRHRPRRRHQQHAGHVRAARRERAGGRRVLRADPISTPRIRPRSWMRRAARSRRFGTSERVRVEPGGARAVFGGARSSCASIRAGDRSRVRSSPCSVHLAESAEETEFIRIGQRPVAGDCSRTLAPGIRVDRAGRQLGQYLDDCGFLDTRVLAVHGVQMARKISSGSRREAATVVTCPRSNGHTGAGVPPIDGVLCVRRPRRDRHRQPRERARSESVCRDARTFGRWRRRCRQRRFSTSATTQGAHALGFGADYGTIDAGKSGAPAGREVPAGDCTAMWKNIWCPACEPEHMRWVESC